MKFKVKCRRCLGTGLSRDWFCKDGEAIECPECEGKGYKIEDYYDSLTMKLFETRTREDGIDTVIVDAAGGISERSERIPYAIWLHQ